MSAESSRRRAASVWRQMFTPAAFPPPKLDALGVAWRYGLAAISYLSFLGMVLLTRVVDPLTSDGQLATLLAAPAWALFLDFGLGLVGFALIRFRRRWPLAIYLLLEASSAVSSSVSAIVVWSFLSLASRRNLRQIAIAIVFSVLVSVLTYTVIPWHSQDLLALGGPVQLQLSGAIGLVLFALAGMYYGVRQDRVAGVRDRAANADRDRELAVLGERNRIAREMHDVLAHRISLVSMHAGALAYRTDLPPEQTRAIAQLIQENAHASLNELRSVLSVLRDGQLDASGAPAPPQPTLADLPGLLTEARSLGQRITLRSAIDPATVEQVASRHAYRIIQEGLTNARKHAPHTTVELTLEGAPGVGLRVLVTNPIGPGSRAAVPGAGLGLIGVRERVTMLGGRLDAGVHDGHFGLDARLPWAAPA